MPGASFVAAFVVHRHLTVATEFPTRAWTILIDRAANLLSHISQQRRAARFVLVGSFHTHAVWVKLLRQHIRHHPAGLL